MEQTKEIVNQLMLSLTNAVRQGQSAETAIATIKDRIIQAEQYDIRLELAHIVNYAASKFLDDDREVAAQLITNLDEKFRTKGTLKIMRILGMDTGDNVSDGLKLIRDGSTDKGMAILRRITDIGRGNRINAAHKLLEDKHIKYALEIISPLLIEGLKRHGNAEGLHMDVLNLYARCAHHDDGIRATFLEKITELHESGALPKEYFNRLVAICKRGKKLHGRKLSQKRYRPPRETLDIQSVTVIGIDDNELPEVDNSGKAKQLLLSCFLDKNLQSAAQHISLLRKEKRLSKAEIGPYERRVLAELSSNEFNEDQFWSILKNDPQNFGMVRYGIVNSLRKKKYLATLSKLLIVTNRNARCLRIFGEGLIGSSRRNFTVIAELSSRLRELELPQSALEILKPWIFDCTSKGKSKKGLMKMLNEFAQCAVIDDSVKTDFVEQISEYSSQRLIQNNEYRKLMATAGIVRKEVPTSSDESFDEFAGRIARSKFFQEPHALLRADPVDITASRVSGKRSRKKR